MDNDKVVLARYRKGDYVVNDPTTRKRYFWAGSKGNMISKLSVPRETFDWSEMCRVQIPLPPIQIQQKIVDLYNCYEECKRIANEAREKISNLCPALVQKATHTY